MARLKLWTGLFGLLVSAPAWAGNAFTWNTPVTGRCVGATASVTMSRLVAENGLLRAEGTWTVGPGVDGVVLDYRIDSDRHQEEIYTVAPGQPGTWRFVEPESTVPCGLHALRAYVYPVVVEDGRQRFCLNGGSSVAMQVTTSCTAKVEIVDCQWECSDDEPLCAGSCTASAHGGQPSYLVYWGLNDRDYQQGVYGLGPWEWTGSCQPGDRVTFKVRSNNGSGPWSNVAEKRCGER